MAKRATMLHLGAMNRPLVPAEQMADRFDRCYTLNFTTVAELRGPLSEDGLVEALRCLERRHPLLRARIDRDGPVLAFVLGEASELALTVVDAERGQVPALVRASIEHSVWDDAGPRGELVWLRHGQDWSTLLLRLHHVVSDGSSGMLAMRDLLTFVAAPELSSVEPLASPGQDSFFPASHAAQREAFLAAPAPRGGAAVEPPFRLSNFGQSSWTERRVISHRIQLDPAQSTALAARARVDGATVHGALCAALAQSIALERGEVCRQVLAHPVDLRRFLRELDPAAPPIGDRVGYYVSAVASEHTVGGGESLGELACAITTQVRAKKEALEPLLTAPIRGPLFVERTRTLSLDALRDLAEQKVFTDTFSVTNLGPLERLGLTSRVGQLELVDCYFVAASSILGQLSGSAVSYGGRISLHVLGVSPLIERAQLERVALRTVTALDHYVAGSLGA